ncbi:uncharacterized protein RSE6_07208 [Rhynchosporium secalis]|uniref:Uncharacterized protein n=1 Tax=Rhynchosporium secalis TaxID=38038 RepID=A0A1E1MCF7_RHYSE|nr:uncharacterized protein RSE6_07208 [Rhynchosporium secalis]
MTRDTYSVRIEGAKAGICLSSILLLIATRDWVIHTSNERLIAEKASGRARVRFECGVYCIVDSDCDSRVMKG